MTWISFAAFQQKSSLHLHSDYYAAEGNNGIKIYLMTIPLRDER